MSDQAKRDRAEAEGIEAGRKDGSSGSILDSEEEAAAREKGYQTGKALADSDDDKSEDDE